MLLDSDVMIDILRGYPPAVNWLTALGATTVGLPGLVAMELLQGCRDRDEQKRVERQLERFTLHWPTQTDCSGALLDLAAYRLSHDLGILDALIGRTVFGLGESLATFNVKHYGVINGLQTVQPY
jgi:predicted nucleic acid-binding protein